MEYKVGQSLASVTLFNFKLQNMVGELEPTTKTLNNSISIMGILGSLLSFLDVEFLTYFGHISVALYRKIFKSNICLPLILNAF